MEICLISSISSVVLMESSIEVRTQLGKPRPMQWLQPKRRRLWLNDRSCIRLRPQHKNHVWYYDFVSDRTHDGTKLRILNVIDEFTKECLVLHVARRTHASHVILILADLFLTRGCPEHIRSDNQPKFVAHKLVKWMKGLDVQPLFIAPGSP